MWDNHLVGVDEETLARNVTQIRSRAVSRSNPENEGRKWIEDLEIGMVLPGIVTNITNFGVFVDIGVKQDGLVHISQLANKFIKNPMDVVRLQQHVKIKVIDIDRKRISLSMKDLT